ncbi:hypothetical protein C7M84_020133 [Penaeus vannamei]|uniref:Integrase catalytic domain-containing protein n=1 Tax=Penaeus vannamei TaxID=6689 RepID=A0A423SCY4_PENVA|nr:hypothetical protein C7M84_020133 [Penaeus vannamei]
MSPTISSHRPYDTHTALRLLSIPGSTILSRTCRLPGSSPICTAWRGSTWLGAMLVSSVMEWQVVLQEGARGSTGEGLSLMDLQGSATGFRNDLSIVDHHTQFIQLVPLRDKSANRVLQAFADHNMTLFGLHDHLPTDNGLEFSSDEWRSLLEALQVQRSFSVAYHPQSNGVVECTNWTVKDALAALARQAHSQWPTHLPAVRLALNSAIHQAVGDQPLYLLTGRMALFGKGLTNRQTVDPDLTLPRLADARQLAVEVSRKMRETNKAQYDQAARTSGPYEEGALVLRKIQGNRGPLGDRWLCPCHVQKQSGPVSYDVLDLRPHTVLSESMLTRCAPTLQPLQWTSLRTTKCCACE